MKTIKSFYAVALAVTLAAAAAAPGAWARPAPRQEHGPLERGFRTGYSDGYQAGWGDQLKRAPNDFRGHTDYRRAERAYVAAYGSLEDYSDGYRQGFEAGYAAGYDRRGFDSSVPAGLARRGAGAPDGAASGVARDDDAAEARDQAGAGDQDYDTSSGPARAGSARSSVPSNTVMRVELLNRLSTDVSQRGDRFEARVLEPAEFEGAVIGGRVTSVQRPGRARGRAEIQLDFDQIRLTNGDWQDFSAQVIEVVSQGGDDAGEVDPEGGVRGRSTTKEDVAKVGAGAGVGAIIGAIAGGGKGAGIGAIIGGAAGTAGVMTQRGRDLRFDRGQQLRIRTSSRRQ